jgi:DNA-binding FadR family transcriptional regulator
MIALETAGLIEVRVGDGTYVRNSPAHTPFPWDREVDPGPGPHEQFRMRMLAECAAAEDAAATITEAEIDRLAALIAAMQADIDGPLAEDQRRQFHRVIAAASRNTILEALIAELWRLRSGEMWRALSRRVVRPEHHVLALEDRKDMLAALRRRDGAGAAKAMRRLLNRIHERYFGE